MLAHTIDCGLQRGYLDESCRPCADKMRNPVIGKVDKYGRVQGVCGAPNFNAPGTAAEGQAFFLLMEAAWALCPQIAGPSKKLSEQRLLQAPSGGSD